MILDPSQIVTLGGGLGLCGAASVWAWRASRHRPTRAEQAHDAAKVAIIRASGLTPTVTAALAARYTREILGALPDKPAAIEGPKAPIDGRPPCPGILDIHRDQTTTCHGGHLDCLGGDGRYSHALRQSCDRGYGCGTCDVAVVGR